MDYKETIRNATVSAFGKIFHSKLTAMNLVVFKKDYGYQAVCIDICMDATGKSVLESCGNLIRKLRLFEKETVKDHGMDEKAAFDHINEIIFGEGELKSLYYARYRQAKCLYISERLAREKRARSAMEAFMAFLYTVFSRYNYSIRSMNVAAS